MKMIEELTNKINQIVSTKKITIWRNSWMWEARNGREYLTYYFLIYNDSRSFKYQDLDDMSIEVKEESSLLGKYRIDIKGRYKTHNFWLFDDRTSSIVMKYIQDIITHQYESIMERYRILDISNDAYYDKEPAFVLTEMRDQKINEILDKNFDI